MRIIIKIIILCSILSSAVIFADDVTNTSTSVTTTTGGNMNGNGNKNTTTESTVTHITTTVTNVDDVIVSAIYKKYANDSALIGTALTVSCKNGVVTLEGSVTAQSQADEAVKVAKSIPSVKDVRSSILVTTDSRVNSSAKTKNY